MKLTEIPRYVILRKIAGDLQIGISKIVEIIIDFEMVNFPREHHFIT
jgi:hypothetical protein